MVSWGIARPFSAQYSAAVAVHLPSSVRSGLPLTAFSILVLTETTQPSGFFLKATLHRFSMAACESKML
jgi:hypothetical protein